jgi:predicted SprT family Zn-dependent metalloprotease
VRRQAGEKARSAAPPVPDLRGAPIDVRFVNAPRADRGRLVSGGSRGEQVHGGSFLRRREIVLDSSLARKPRELTRIFLHELFHFVWLRVGNERRRSWEQVLAREWAERARGELGWSAESRKGALEAADVRRRSRRWREYACESFCDSAAWLYSGLGRHSEFTLASRFRRRRERWFRTALGGAAISI